MRRAAGIVSSSLSAVALIVSAGSVVASGGSHAVNTQVPLFPETMTSQEWAALPRGEWASVGGVADFAPQATVWTGDGLQGASGAAAPATLTYSFPSDAASWTLGVTNATNALNAALTATFGAGHLDEGKEYIRQAMGAWKRSGKVTFTEVNDDDAAFGTSVTRVATRGDIRIGGIPLGTSGQPLAGSNPPTSGGDIAFNTSFFNAGNFGNSLNNFRTLRNTAGHEIGTALGLQNVVPCNATKLMEGQLNTNFDGPQIDDIRGIERCYGDRYAGNNSSANAKDFGGIVTVQTNAQNPRSIREAGLSTNGLTGANATGEDWFRFQTNVNFIDLTVSATPTGGTYNSGAQSGGACNGSNASVNATQAGVLRLELFQSNGTTLVVPASQPGIGLTPSINVPLLSPGTYFVRVSDVGPNAAANQITQTYDLYIRNGAAASAEKALPVANAGVNKRVPGGSTAYFMGDINSFATESGATITSYDWDLDGDGLFEIVGNARPTKVFTVDGVVPVTLRVTDSNMKQSTDTINVTVFGSVTGVAWRTILNSTNPVIAGNPAPGSDTISGAAWTSGGPWQTFDLVVEGRSGAQITGINFGADGSANQLNVVGTVFNHAIGGDIRTFALETNASFAALFFDTYACFGGTNTVNGPITSFAGSTGGLAPSAGNIKFTSFAPAGLPASLVADASAPAGGSVRVLRVSVKGTLGGGTSRVQVGFPNNTSAIINVPTAVFVAPACPGDTNGDQTVNFFDLNDVLTAYNKCTGQPGFIPGADLDHSGCVDFFDLNTVLTEYNHTCAADSAPVIERGEILEIVPLTMGTVDGCAGDVNHDGSVAFADLSAVLNALGLNAQPGFPCDLNADGLVDFADLDEVLSHYGQGR